MPKITLTTCSGSQVPSASDLAVRLENVDFSYTKEPFFQNISACIEKSSFVAIFGPNGGGKSTFIKLLLGFLQPDQGNVWLLNQNPKKSRHKAGYVPQIADLDKAYPISAIEVVKMGLMGKKSLFRRQKQLQLQAEKALSAVGLLHLAQKHFGSLSGGEAQRVLIARAIVDEPDVLILDEPTSSLDTDSEKIVIELLKKFQEKMTILMVTHDLGSILSHADKLLCIHRQVCELSKDAVCQHYGLGLYHTPMQES